MHALNNYSNTYYQFLIKTIFLKNNKSLLKLIKSINFDLIIMQNLLLENIKISITNVKSHLLRSLLTMAIIAFGIMALVGILTAIDSIKGSISSNFASMGANSFSIINRQTKIEGFGRHKSLYYKNITYQEAIDFKERADFPGIISINAFASGGSTIKHKSKKTNPNISIYGVDENYLTTAGYNIEKGRNFNINEIKNARNVVIIGNEIKNKLFPTSTAINKLISIGGAKYLVIGVLESKGASMGFNSDRQCLIPLNKVKASYYRPNMNFIIDVKTKNNQSMEAVIGESTALFRIIRKLKPADENNFSIRKSDNISQMMLENMRYVRIVAFIIAIITLLGASIGLMNIMLVTVKERTREIGVRKALGATNKIIRNQFLTEAIVITELGGILGTLFGIILGNIVSNVIGSSFIIPWLWIFVALIVSVAVGLISGIFPASKASKLNPIDSLRYE